MAASKVTEVRAGFNSEQWQAWRSPSDQSNPAQLKRIVSEWAEQKEILSTLTEIDPNPSRALGLLLASHQLVSSATITIAAAPAVAIPETEPDDFIDNTDEF